MLIFILLSICPSLIVFSIIIIIVILQFSLFNMTVKKKKKPTQEAQFVGERWSTELQQQQQKPLYMFISGRKYILI